MRAIIVLLTLLFILSFLWTFDANADSRKRTYDWKTGETCVETCWTDIFGNENCSIVCY